MVNSVKEDSNHLWIQVYFIYGLALLNFQQGVVTEFKEFKFIPSRGLRPRLVIFLGLQILPHTISVFKYSLYKIDLAV